MECALVLNETYHDQGFGINTTHFKDIARFESTTWHDKNINELIWIHYMWYLPDRYKIGSPGIPRSTF